MAKNTKRTKSKNPTKKTPQNTGEATFFSKLIVVALIVFAVFYVKDNFFSDGAFEFPDDEPKKRVSQNLPKDTEPVKPEPKTPAKPEPKTEKPVAAKPTAEIYFTSATKGGVKKVTRPLPDGQSRVKFAVEELLKGPDLKEKNLGFSSEIPKGTRLLGVYEIDGQIIVNLSDEFQYGGGTESQYSRLKQLIKTVLAQKPSKPVYLYLNGEKAEMIGGEGLIITQPLSENSLNG